MPSDLPTSLNDRRPVTIMSEETEIYDAWQGERWRQERCAPRA